MLPNRLAFILPVRAIVIMNRRSRRKNALVELTAGVLNRSFVSNLADVLVLLIGLTSTVTVKFVGDLPVSEVILISVLPILVAARGRRLKGSQFKILYALLGLWLFGQVISDIYRQSGFVDWARGDAAIIFFGFDLLGLVILLRRNDRRKLILIAASAIGSIVVTIIHPSDFAQDQPWKFGYATGVINLALLISCYFYARRRYISAGLLIVFVAGVNLLENYRGPVGGLLIVIALAFPVIPDRIGRLPILPRQNSLAGVAIRLGLGVSAILLASVLIRFVTASGVIGEEAASKNEAQERAGSLLLGGRPEIQVSSLAVLKSPIIGYGSWPRDSQYVEMLFDIEVERGVVDPEDTGELSTDLIPTHSHLMGAWVWAGLLGAAFWLYILWLIAQSIIRVVFLRPSVAPIYIWIITGMFWGVMFSPFGLNVRLSDAMVIVIMLDLMAECSLSASSESAGHRKGLDSRQFRRISNRSIC